MYLYNLKPARFSARERKGGRCERSSFVPFHKEHVGLRPDNYRGDVITAIGVAVEVTRM